MSSSRSCNLWLWYTQRKSSSNFPKTPSTSLHSKCNPMSDHAHRTQGSTRLYLPPAPMLENPCVPILTLLRFLHGCDSSSHARAGTSTSCIPKMRSCSCPTSVPFLCPFGRAPPIPLSIFFLSVLKLLSAAKDSQPSRFDTM